MESQPEWNAVGISCPFSLFSSRVSDQIFADLGMLTFFSMKAFFYWAICSESSHQLLKIR
jgi:hypothetical protein